MTQHNKHCFEQIENHPKECDDNNYFNSQVHVTTPKVVMMSLLSTKSFQPNVIASVTTLVVFVILCKLGFWQLDRASEKEAWLAQFNNTDLLTIEALSETSRFPDYHGKTIQLKNIKLEDNYWLLDNQVYKGQVGYGVIGLLKLSNYTNIFVHLGWVQAPKYRTQVPTIKMPISLDIDGVIKAKDFGQFNLASIEQQENDYRVQTITQVFATTESDPDSTLLIYAKQNQQLGWPQTYKPVSMKPEKHRAYATQWFMLAIAAVIVFLFASLKEKEVYESQ